MFLIDVFHTFSVQIADIITPCVIGSVVSFILCGWLKELHHRLFVQSQ